MMYSYDVVLLGYFDYYVIMYKLFIKFTSSKVNTITTVEVDDRIKDNLCKNANI